DYAVGISGFNTDDYEFAVTSQNVTITLGETANVPFDGILRRTSGVAGRVSVGGMGIADVTVTVSADGMDDVTETTDATGQYAISALAAGDYTVTISGYDEVEYSFEDSQSVTLAMDQTMIVNFDGTALRTGSISVSVTADGEGVAGAGVTLTEITGATSGTVLGTQATDANGATSFGPLLAGNYRVDIAVDSDEISFESTSAMVAVATAEMASASFEGAIDRSGSIGGSVTVDGNGMGGVSVMLAGGGDDVAETMMTNDDGDYSFSGLRKGDYTVSITNPDEARYEFASTSESVSLAVGQSQSVNFAGAMTRSSSISGTVSVEGSGLAGVAVTLSGAADDTKTTDAGGGYAFTNLGAGDYTVAIALSEEQEAAYNFETTSMDLMVGDNEAATANFEGTHDASASISGMLFVDEGTDNDMMDDGENPLAAAGVVVILVGPGVNEQRPTATNEDGMFSFADLRAGTYQLVVQVPPQVAMAMPDYAYGGPATGYEIDLGVGASQTQNIPFDITHTTVNFSVTLKSGDETGDAIPGATVNLYSDADGDDMAGTGMTGEDGMASIRIARAGTMGNMVYAKVSHDDYAGDGMTTVMWDSQSTATSASNEGDIVNLNVDATFGGATVDRGDYGGGKALAGWAVSVMMGDSAVADASEELDDDGMGAFSMAVDAVPATFSIAVDTVQDNKLDGGEDFDADAIDYVHDGLSLAGTMDAGMLEVTYTTQTLKVYVHHERDQVMGYTGSVLGGDARMSGMVDVGIRYIADNGRSRTFASDVWKATSTTFSDSKGVVTFRGVPADANVIAVADEVAQDPEADDYQPIMLLGPDELAAYTADDGATGGMFGANGGFHHTVELCPLMAVDPTGQDHGECGSFAFVETYAVHGQAWKNDVVMNAANDGFTVRGLRHVPGTTVDIDPVDGKNLAGESESFTAASSDNRRTAIDERKQFNFGRMAAGVYKVTVPDKWVAKIGTPDNAAGSAAATFNPLAGDAQVDVTPTTGILYGRVNGADGFPLDSTTVTVNGMSTETDEFGRYIVEGFSHVVGANNKSGDAFYRKQVVAVSASRGGFDAYADTMLFAGTVNTPTEHNIDLAGTAETATVSGTVTAFGSTTPIAGVEIRVD
ncbi:MAG: carboxypeptidase regulatory-like domain-containing protein, partial [Gammaproteobacteria bacterium]|nr:carboxypeptidase regulatory-like domain-containing protein [Gammaproteobacteria bacterium]